MTALHIYTAGKQPATRCVVDLGGRVGIDRLVMTMRPRQLARCHNCRRLRWAANLTVQVYYDYTRFACVDKAKCKAGRRGKRRNKP